MLLEAERSRDPSLLCLLADQIARLEVDSCTLLQPDPTNESPIRRFHHSPLNQSRLCCMNDILSKHSKYIRLFQLSQTSSTVHIGFTSHQLLLKPHSEMCQPSMITLPRKIICESLFTSTQLIQAVWPRPAQPTIAICEQFMAETFFVIRSWVTDLQHSSSIDLPLTCPCLLLIWFQPSCVCSYTLHVIQG